MIDTCRNRLTFAILAMSVCFATAQKPSLNTNHRQLDYYQNNENDSRRILSPEDWAIRKTQILEGFEKAAGKLPDRKNLLPLDIVVHEELVKDYYIRQRIDFASEPNDRTPAYLYIPTSNSSTNRKPAIVALHPTHKIGKGVVDGQSERPNRAYAKELAERGYVVIAPDYMPFGDYEGYDFEEDRYESGTMKGIWNHMRCVDLLRARSDVAPDRIGAIGHSLGGHNAIFLGVFDTRVKVIVTSCGWTPFHDYYGGKIVGWTSDRYLPRLNTNYDLNPDKVPFDFYELIAALAPRAFFSNSPLRDSNFDYRGAEKAAPIIRKIYNLFDAPERMRITYPLADHDFPTEVRHEAYAFLDHWLNELD